MRTVSFQGTQLSRQERARLEFHRQTRSAFLNSHLQLYVSETIAELDQRKEQGVKPERQWTLVYESKGTPCVAEYFGF